MTTAMEKKECWPEIHIPSLNSGLVAYKLRNFGESHNLSEPQFSSL